jgi:hypothetical protein
VTFSVFFISWKRGKYLLNYPTAGEEIFSGNTWFFDNSLYWEDYAPYMRNILLSSASILKLVRRWEV